MYCVEFHNLNCLSDTRLLKNSFNMGKKCGLRGIESNLNRFVIGKQEGKSAFRRPV
jgi:hypothetical protein